MTAAATIHLGTSAFTANGWAGTFYPRGMKPADYLGYYAEHFDTVEIDSTLYGCPKPSTVANWKAKTPTGFVFAVKTPRIITHDKVLVDCGAEVTEFIETMDILGEKLGSILLQFPFFSRAAFKTQTDFLGGLIPFLKRLPSGHRYAVEIRNREWLDPQFVGILRDFGVALVLQDNPLMPRPHEIEDKIDPVSSDQTYVRWLGDRKGIEEITRTWDKIVTDRTVEMNHWADYCWRTMKRGVEVYVYVNNHYAGYAPATIQQFRAIWKGRNLPPLKE